MIGRDVMNWIVERSILRYLFFLSYSAGRVESRLDVVLDGEFDALLPTERSGDTTGDEG